MNTTNSITGLSLRTNEYEFDWNPQTDVAHVRPADSGTSIWRGSLLPLFWLRLADGTRRCVKATVVGQDHIENKDARKLTLRFDELGSGNIEVAILREGISFERLIVRWNDQPAPAIISMHFGSAPLTPDQSDIVPTLDVPFWPNWTSDGFCIPSAKGAPIQSFFRCWDFGHATLPLGSFGPQMGTPYAAAFPRPLYAMAMGSDAGWVIAGPGEVPDAAMSLQIKSSSAALEFLYREDLWGAGPSTREWKSPLRLCWAKDAWAAYERLFETFDIPASDGKRHSRSSINSWGSFKIGDFDIRRLADRTVDLGAQMLVIDDLWETFNGSGEPDLGRFPRFDDDLEYVRSKGLAIGVWQSIGWIDDPASVGLTNDDLLCGADGRPRRANWAMNPHGPPSRFHYCLDVSSPRTRSFIRERVGRVMRRFSPVLLKLDFGYGLPGPDVAVAKDIRLRGERMSYELMRLTVEAAREIDPNVTIQYYGIHPLMRPLTDVIALDDLGDAGAYEAAGHGQWSVWSALVGASGMAIMASSGYDWAVDEEILLDSAVIGAPGCVLPIDGVAKGEMTPSRLCHRRAVARWFRRSSRWKPLWLDTERGRSTTEPLTKCWGRIENFDGVDCLTSLVLRMTDLRQTPPPAIPVRNWSGRWAIIAQDDRSIESSRAVVCIPMDSGDLTLHMQHSPTRVLAITGSGERVAQEVTVKGSVVRIAVDPNTTGEVLGYVIVGS